LRDDWLKDDWTMDGCSGIGCKNLYRAHREIRCDFARLPFPMSFEPGCGTGVNGPDSSCFDSVRPAFDLLTLAVFRSG
jgi:hypothetical protein